MQDHLDSEQCVKMSQREHILTQPDMYIGSVDTTETTGYLFDTDGKIVYKNYEFNPGLFKLFDEGIVNCRDHFIRMNLSTQENKQLVTNIDVNIDKHTGSITLMNNGNGLPVCIHTEHNLWIPQMMFTELLTGTNFNKKEKVAKGETTGGKNGIGAKAIFIWSTYAELETVDHTRGLKFVQKYENNMTVIHEPKVTKCKQKSYTKITFVPDFARFGKTGITDDEFLLYKRRAHDVSAVTGKQVKVKFNGTDVQCKELKTYVDLFVDNKVSKIYEMQESGNKKWEYVIILSPYDEYRQMSFVNGVHTSKGGKHVEYIMNQIVKQITETIKSKKKIDVKPQSIKRQLMLFLCCDIVNPSFQGQTKDELTTVVKNFGSSCTVTQGFIDKIIKLGVVDRACEWTEMVNTNKTISTQGGKTKQKRIRGVPKLSEANFAGTNKSKECTLFIVEGDSAKAGVLSGMNEKLKDIYAVYPCKGKFKNVREEKIDKIFENNEISELRKIIGLEINHVYKSLDEIYSRLRYGRIIFLTDQDLDGIHIKCLGINLFDFLWCSLLKLGVIGYMNTPIVKATKGNNTEMFYNEHEFETWKLETPNSDKWTSKYYKGLGTSTKTEFKEYLRLNKIVMFEHTGAESNNAIRLAFDGKADHRKQWVKDNMKRNDLFIDASLTKVPVEMYVHKELINFSIADCVRSLPDLFDACKPSIRKILFSAFKRNLTKEIKVAQFAGYVSEHSGYHHGEASLHGAIVKMAQNYIGSNNVNLLQPCGQFGSRINDTAASPRYIFTRLENITRHIFNPVDDKILEYNVDENGDTIEPKHYAPIVPMILVNGNKGIGTGFSCNFPSYNIVDIITYLKNKLTHVENQIELHPYVYGFKGNISKVNESQYLMGGLYEKKDEDTLIIKELPSDIIIDKYKTYLENHMDDSWLEKKKKPKYLKDMTEHCTDNDVHIEITFLPGKLTELENTKTTNENINMLEQFLQLKQNINLTNMHCFHEGEILKFDNVYDIIDAYFIKRLPLFEKRKTYIIQKLEKELILLRNQKTYVTKLLEGSLDLRNKPKQTIETLLIELLFDKIDDSFEYLLKLRNDCVSEEKVNELFNAFNKKTEELECVKNKTIETMWLEELDALGVEYANFVNERVEEARENAEQSNPIVVKKVVKKKLKKSNV